MSWENILVGAIGAAMCLASRWLGLVEGREEGHEKGWKEGWDAAEKELTSVEEDDEDE